METDPVKILAIREGAWVINKFGEFRIEWRLLMRSRRTYRDIPEYAKLTAQQIDLYHKLHEGDFMPLRAACLILGTSTQLRAWSILRAKKVPVYKFPPSDGLHILSTDFVKMVDSCKIDLEAEGGVWDATITRSLEKADRRARNLSRKRGHVFTEANQKRRRNIVEREVASRTVKQLDEIFSASGEGHSSASGDVLPAEGQS